MKVVLRGVLLGPLISGCFEDDPRIRQATAMSYIFAGVAAYLIVWATGLHFLFVWAILPPTYALMHGVWHWRFCRRSAA